MDIWRYWIPPHEFLTTFTSDNNEQVMVLFVLYLSGVSVMTPLVLKWMFPILLLQLIVTTQQLSTITSPWYKLITEGSQCNGSDWRIRTWTWAVSTDCQTQAQWEIARAGLKLTVRAQITAGILIPPLYYYTGLDLVIVCHDWTPDWQNHVIFINNT